MLKLRRLLSLSTVLVPNHCNAFAVAATATNVSSRHPPSTPKQSKILPALPQITCKVKRFNLEAGTRPPSGSLKFGTIELASAGWNHHKAKGDFFTIHPSSNWPFNGDALNANDDECLPFDKFGLDECLLANLNTLLANSIESSRTPDMSQTLLCSAVQARALPQILAGDHTLIAAETGCGKTLAYLVPIVQQLLQRNKMIAARERDEMNTPRALVLTPGRELGNVQNNRC